jgi:hypothetical protein
MKERTPRVDRAELPRRTFDVFACVRCGGRFKGTPFKVMEKAPWRAGWQEG